MLEPRLLDRERAFFNSPAETADAALLVFPVDAAVRGQFQLALLRSLLNYGVVVVVADLLLAACAATMAVVAVAAHILEKH